MEIQAPRARTLRNRARPVVRSPDEASRVFTPVKSPDVPVRLTNNTEEQMEKQQLLVMVKDGKVTLALELGAFTINVPEVSFQIPRIGNDVHVHAGQNAGKGPFGRFLLRPGIFSAAGFVTVLGLWR